MTLDRKSHVSPFCVRTVFVGKTCTSYKVDKGPRLSSSLLPEVLRSEDDGPLSSSLWLRDCIHP